MRLPEVVKKYLAAAGGYGKFVSIASAWAFRDEETERVFDFLDEDYHISRFFHFRNAAGRRGGRAQSSSTDFSRRISPSTLKFKQFCNNGFQESPPKLPARRIANN